MMRTLGRWVLGLAVLFAAISLVAFVLDWAVYKLRGSPQSTVAVSQFMEVPLKGRKDGVRLPGDAECPVRRRVVSARKEDPCWNLRRNPNQWEKVGTPAY